MKSIAQIQVRKLNLAGQITWQYPGRILLRQPELITLEAFFDRADLPLLDVVLKRNDRFVETFYSDRWYNVFEIYDRDDQRLKGWYCNVSRPAVLSDEFVSYVDLALDLWVAADGRQTVLDEDEFDALALGPSERGQALEALGVLQHRFATQHSPE